MEVVQIYKTAWPFLLPPRTYVYRVGWGFGGPEDTGYIPYASLAAVYRAAHRLGFTHATTPKKPKPHRIPKRYREE